MNKIISVLMIIIGVTGCNTSEQVDAFLGGVKEVVVSAPVTGTTLSIVGGNFQSGAPGATFFDPLRVQLLRNGSPVSGANVNFTIVSGPAATFSASSGTTDASGILQTFVTAGGAAGSLVVRAAYNGSTVDFSLTVSNQSNSALVRISGDAQSAPVGTSVSLPLVVETRDATTGVPVSNILVRFNVGTGNGRINSNTNSLAVSSDGTGRASVNFDVGTLMGANTVTATIVSVPAQSVVFSLTGTVPTNSVVSPVMSAVTTSAVTLVADGSQTTTVTLTTRDVYGNTIPVGGKTVVFSSNVGTLVGSAVSVGNGTYTQSLRVPANNSTSQMTVTASVDGVALTSAPASVTLTSGSLSLTQSTVASAANSIAADGTAITLITVTLKDNLGNQQTTGGQTVTLSTTLGTLIGSVTDVGNGTYTQTLKSSTTSGTATVSANVSGNGAITQTKAVAFLAGAPDATQSTIVATPSTLLPNGSASSIITVQLRDAYGNISSTATSRTVTLTKTNGTWMGSAGATVTATSNNDGTYFAILTAASVTGNSVITATDNTAILSRTATVYFSNGAYGPNAANSTITLSNLNPQPANGVSTVNVTVTLKDSFYSQLTTGGSAVVISSTSGTLVGSVVDNGNGTYTQTLRAPSSSAIATVTATVDSVALTTNAKASFYGAISLSQSTITASPSSIIANGTATTTVFLNAKDASGISIPVGGETGLAFASTFGALQGTITDNNNGVYSQVLQSTAAAHIASVTATKAAAAFSATANVSFYVANNLAGVTIDCSNIATYQNTTLVVNNGTLNLNTKSAAGYCPNSFVFAGVVLQNNAILTHSATTSTQEFWAEFSANYITIDSTSSIDVSAKGYPIVNNNNIRTQGNVDFSVGGRRTGGSYGGQGHSQDTTQLFNATYGSIFQPFDLGSSGSYVGGSAGAGGGKLKITVTGETGISNAGSIKAVGGVPNDNSASGSGGSIWITTTALTGAGKISADGGRWTTQGGNFNIMAGGGGRVAIYYTNGSTSGNFSYPTNMLANVTAKGGLTSSGCAAGAGTVYLKSSTQTYGDLIIDNKGATRCVSNDNGTVMNSPTINASESVNATSLTKTNAFADSYSSTSFPFIGYYLDPNIAQNATPKKSDNQLYKITASTASALTTTGGDMTSVAAAGNAAELVLVLDNLEIGDNTYVNAGNLRFVSYGGDLRSNDSTTATVSGTFLPAGVEYVGLQNLSVTNLGLQVQPSFLNEDFSGTNFTISGGSFTSTSLKTANFTSTSMTLTGGKIRATGSVTFNSTIGTFGQLVGNYAIQADGVVSLLSSTTITQTQTTATNEYSLEILCSGYNQSSNSTLSAQGRGFSTAGSYFRVLGNQYATTAFNGNVNIQAGGSHGGRGGGANGGHFPSEVYGSYINPYTTGASGGNGGSNGGGIIRITASNGGSISVDGLIDGRASSSTSVGGAGGSIYLNGGTVGGAGAIDAGSSASGYVGGGGGRIAIYYNTLAGNFTYPTNALANIRAYGGWQSTNGYQTGAAGTVFLKSSAETYGKLVINNNNQVTAADSYGTRRTVVPLPAPATIASISYNAGANTSTITVTNAFNETYGPSSAFVGMYFNPNVAQNATSKISDDTLFKVVAQTASSLTVTGDVRTIASSGNTFQLNLKLDALKVVNNGVLEIDNGVIFATELDVTNGQIVGSGSVETTPSSATVLSANGGTVNLNNVTPNGALTLQNGTFVITNGSTLATAGDLTLSTATVTGSNLSLNVQGNLTLNSSVFPANAVTTTGDLNLTNSTLTATGAMTVGGAMIVTSSSTVTEAVDKLLAVSGNFSISNTSTVNAGIVNVGGNLSVNTVSVLSSGNRVLTPFTTYNTVSSLNVTGNTSITNGSTLTSPFTNATEEYYLYLTTANVTLDNTAFIQVDGRGYRSQTNQKFRSLGNLDYSGYNGNTPVSVNNTYSGGSYGGFGGSLNNNYYPSKTYGSYALPIHLGSSGATSDGASYDSGGGSIRMNISGTALINGTVSSNGVNFQPSNPSYYSNVSGSGGSVYIQTNTLSGSGSIRANSLQNGSNYYGSGGGGRIAVYYQTATDSWATDTGKVAGFQAYGGTSPSNSNASYNRGGAGTIYLKKSSQTYGDMIINNNGVDTLALTPLWIPAGTASSALSTNSLTSALAFSNIFNNAANFFVGMYLNPNMAQNATAKLSDDTLFLISSNDGSVANTATSGMTSIASSGNNFSVVNVFDNLEVKGKAKLSASYIRVLSGDLGSNDTATFSQDGGITATELDLGSGVTWNVTAGASGTVTQKCSANYACP